MKQTEHNTSFTVIDIQRYHAGELSMQERHALEKAALDDPFLADALEGYQHTASHQADLTELQQRLTGITSSKRKGALVGFFQKPWMRIAALALLLAGAGWIVSQISFKSSNDLAQSKAVAPKITEAPAKTTVQDAIADTIQVIGNTTSADSSIAVGQPYQTMISKNDGLAVSDKKRSKDAGRKEIPSAPSETPTDIAAKTVITEATPTPVLQARTQSEGVTKNTFKGQILDPNGNPIPNASIAITGRREGTVSNAQGKFSLTASDSVVNATVAALGFESSRISLKDTEEKKVVLNESSNALQEVVVVGYGTTRKREASKAAARKNVEVEELEPEEGWYSFNNYVSQNLQIPEEVAKKKLAGEVELSFEVNKNGEPINIKVEKSLCESCDKEAVRLLKEGPGWKKKKRKAGKVKIRF